jgi:serine/threonine-protein kinase
VSLTPGARLGAYEVVARIGAGGMGEVYRAHDTKLNRAVALKVLSDLFATDAERLARFKREAQVLASLNHPNIGGIHGFEEADSVRALVLELVEGPTLADRIAQGAIPVDEAVPIARQIAEALEAAHERGVIHRDLKPSNIKLRPDGTVKVLDFGLAKALEPTSAGRDLSQSPTLTSPAMTQIGVILGTAAYMSPEQAKGKVVDKRADIWAFGCVFYEMLTGRRPYQGDTSQELIASILRDDVDLNHVPAQARRLLNRCLEKDPQKRLRHIGDVMSLLDEPPSGPRAPALEPSGVRAGAGLVPAPSTWLWPAVAAAIALAAIGIAVWALTRSTAPAPATVSRLLLAPAATAPLVSVGGYDVTISPDGTKIVYLGEAPQGGRALYVRELGGLEPQLIRGTEVPADFGNLNPFFSWDGASIGFRSIGKGILRIALAGGPPAKIADDEPGFVGAAWGPDDIVIMALARGSLTGKGNGLYRVSAGGGGAVERVLGSDDPNVLYAAPSMLPGGKAVLFYLIGVQAQTETVTVLDLETHKAKMLVEGGANPMYAPSGHLVFARGTTLMATPFDLARLEMTGTPGAVLLGVRHPELLTAADYAVSRTGTLIYVPEPESTGPGTTIRPVWVDRGGREIGPVLNVSGLNPQNPRLSPDGKRLLLVSGPLGDTDVSIFDLGGRPPLPVADTGDNLAPMWSRDGARVLFTSSRGGTWGLYSIPSDGSVLQPESIAISFEKGTDAFSPVAPLIPLTWMSDGRLILAVLPPTGGGSDLVALPADGGKADALIKTEFNEDSARVSPDGRWLAYRSNRSGRSEIWVRATAGSAPVRVSQDGGREPVWSRDGRELFYLQGNKMIALAVKAGPEFSFASPVVLFDRPYFHGWGGDVVAGLEVISSYDVAADGRFLMIPEAGGESNRATAPATGIVVVQNWDQELKRLAPTR